VESNMAPSDMATQRRRSNLTRDTRELE
jgi:hypothetical protein